MARNSMGAWYRAGKGAWYATVDGKAVSLGVRGEGNRPEAMRAWHRLMAEVPAEKPQTESTPPKPSASDITVRQLADAFLKAKEGAVKPQTHYGYGCLLKAVAGTFGKVSDLTADAFGKWLRGLNLSASSKHGIAGAVMTATKWATATGLIPADPLRGFKRPRKASRGAKAVITDDVHVRLYNAASAALQPLLTLLWETGARPSELARLTAKDVDLVAGVATLAEHKTDHTGRPRLIYLTPEAVAVLKALAERRPSGALLRNDRGEKWTADAIGHAMRRASRRAGVKGVAYGYRHTYATQALASGVPDATVAALLGHSGTAMLHRHYSHLTSQAQVLREAAARVRG
jgi:integrase